MSDILLSSSSPRRKSLLESIGLEFEIFRPKVDERYIDGETPAQYCLRLSAEKARYAHKYFPEKIIISADTIVICDDEILGKPIDRKDAFTMLRKLSGRTHHVMTGLCVIIGADITSECVETSVKFREISSSEISAYIATGESDDKAGGYAAQGLGALFIERIEGDYYNVVGLPLFTLGKILMSHNIPVV